MTEILKATAPLLTRPANTTAYAALDLVANSTTASAVTNREFVFPRFRGVMAIKKVLLRKTDADVANAQFTLHLFTTAPTYATNGDNSPVSGNTTATGYIGSLTIASMYATAAAAYGQGVPVVGTEVMFDPDFDHNDESVTLYGVLQAAAAYAPASGGTFSLTIEGAV